MDLVCDDNRFELIEKYRKELIEATNIESSPDEMAVLNTILFRFWQMGWLDKLELPSVQPERTEYIPDTKAIPSEEDCVDLSERVIATYYDEEHEEWSQKTVTIRDVLDSVCDEYTILPSAQPEITEEDVKKYCRERCFAIVDGALYEEMKARWSQPEIIRCEKCEHYTALTGICEVRGKGRILIRRPDDFCSRGARRREDG